MARRNAARSGARKKRKKGLRFGRLVIVLILAAAVAASVVFTREYMGSAPKDGASAAREVEIAGGARTADIAEALHSAGVIDHPLLFRVVSRLGGHDASYKQGTFQLAPHTGYAEIFKTLSDSSNGQTDAVKVTIPEGFELRQIADRLEEAGLIDRERFYDEVENGSFDYEFLKDIPERENRLEGYLFPDTYFFVRGTDTERTIIDAMLARFEEEVYTPENQAAALGLGMSMDDVVTLASIIEREAVGDEDRKDVSSVFHNRLKSSQYPYLQSCATVQYILKERKAVLSEADTKIDSPYNTYQNKGLPIGPIASPGTASVDAALHPNRTDYLFFALGKDGVHHFSKTYEEHLNYVK